MAPSTAILRTGEQVPMETVHAVVSGLQTLAGMNYEAFEALAFSVRDDQYEMTEDAAEAAGRAGLIQDGPLAQDVRAVILAATSARAWGFKIVPCLDYDAMGLNRKRDRP